MNRKECFNLEKYSIIFFFFGEHCYSVALDEAHEMEINLKTKNALDSFNQSSLATLMFCKENTLFSYLGIPVRTVCSSINYMPVPLSHQCLNTCDVAFFYHL
jgi:hypothetical protein